MVNGSRKVFVDSNVLIAAARGTSPVAERAIAILGNRALRFVSSPLVRLEVLPKAHFFGRTQEVDFYQVFFSQVEIWAPLDANIVSQALDEALLHGLARWTRYCLYLLQRSELSYLSPPRENQNRSTKLACSRSSH